MISKWIFSQYINTVELLFTLGISLVLFFKISPEAIPSWRSFLKKAKERTFTCHETKVSKPEVATVVLMIVLPLLFNWIPFTTNSYGQFGTWCWIRILNQNCTTNTAGWWEELWLWNVLFGLRFCLILLLLVATLYLLGYGIKNAKVHNYKLIEVGIIEYLLLLVFLVFASCFSPLDLCIQLLYPASLCLLAFSAISSPFIGTFNPLALLFAIH